MFPEGIFAASLKLRTLSLQENEGLLLYTDGLIEAMNAAGEQLGGQAVHELMQRLGTEKETQVTHGLLGLVEKHRNGHSLSDDLTLLSLRRGQVQARPIEPVATASRDAKGGSLQ